MARRKKKTQRSTAEEILKILRRSKQKKVANLKRIQKPDEFWDVLVEEMMDASVDDDPLFQRYMEVHNFVGGITEVLVELKPCLRFQRVFDEASEIYMPGGPPLSPITHSFFQHWSLFDLQLGRSKESMGQIVLQLLQVIYPDFEGFEELRNLLKSRFGFYFVRQKNSEGLILVREYSTKEEAWINIYSGYKPEVGEIIFGRLFGLDGFDYKMMITTPYLLGGFTQSGEELLHQVKGLNFFLEKALKQHQMSYEDFLKHGPSRYYWLEYVFQAYSSHNSKAIALLGYPNAPESTPYSEVSRTGEELSSQYSQDQLKAEIHQKTKGRKGSEIILEFLKPWLKVLQTERGLDKEKIDSLITLGAALWNLEVLENRGKEIDAEALQAVDHFSSLSEDANDIMVAIRERKRVLFGEYDFIIMDYFVQYERDEFKLSIEFA